jgi:hypothetical protein
MDAQHCEPFFSDQVVFLTGGTGGLGGLSPLQTGLETPNSTDNCALLLNRESQSLMEVVNALEAQSYSEHGEGDTHHWRHYAAKLWYPAFPDRADNNRYQCGAANISFSASLEYSIRDNCLAPLELARLISSLTKVLHFIKISSVYGNSFLPDGPVEGRIYPLDDAETELKNPIHVSKFAWPYSYAKHMRKDFSRNDTQIFLFFLLDRPRLDQHFIQPTRYMGHSARLLSSRSSDPFQCRLATAFSIPPQVQFLEQTFSKKYLLVRWPIIFYSMQRLELEALSMQVLNLMCRAHLTRCWQLFVGMVRISKFDL